MTELVNQGMPNTEREREWITEAGYPALCGIVWQPMRGGHRCGYVGLPPDHALYGVDFMDIDAHVDVHGGVTFAEQEALIGWWWVGFDCSHEGDGRIQQTHEQQVAMFPMLAELPPTPDYVRDSMRSLHSGPVRSLEYVVEHCESLAFQLKQLEGGARQLVGGADHEPT